MTDEKNTEKDMELNTEENKNQENAAEGQENVATPQEAAAEESAPQEDPLEVAQAEIADLKKQLLYKIAEFDNYRKRTMSEKADLIPADGVLLAPTAVEFTEGESVFDVLKRVCRKNKIHMEFSETPVYQSAYIEGIGNLYEFDCGEGSGWMYRVNDEFPNYGCSRYTLADSDTVEWVYTCDFGADVGGRVGA